MRWSVPNADAPHPHTRSCPHPRATAGHPTASRTNGQPIPPTDRSAAEAHRAVIERRRLVAGLVVVVVLALGVGIAVLVLRGEGQAPVARVPASTSTTPAPDETRPSAATYHAEPVDNDAVDHAIHGRRLGLRAPRGREAPAR